MIRELSIWIYLTVFKVIFCTFKLMPLSNKLTFVVSFGDNCLFIYNELRRQNRDCDVVFLYKSGCKLDFNELKDIKAIPFETANIFDTIRSIFHLATSKHIIIDNYYGFLSSVNFKDGVTCTQVWHAAGALKKFGLLDHSIKQRSKRDNRRFREVYKKFQHLVVGSDEMATIFKKTFGVSDQNIIKTGIPRTDLFYDEKQQGNVNRKLGELTSKFNKKKVILYAPTFRDGELNSFNLKLDLEKMSKKLSENYILLLKLHPAISNSTNYAELYPNFVYDCSSYIDLNELLLISDLLITDYSSIPFEFSLLHKPMIFFAYDLDEYRKERGLWDEYEEMVPGPVVHTTEEVISCIEKDSFQLEEIKQFAMKWNKYSRGNSSEMLVDFLFEHANTKRKL